MEKYYLCYDKLNRLQVIIKKSILTQIMVTKLKEKAIIVG